MIRRCFGAGAAALACTLLAACAEPDYPLTRDGWRAVITLPGGELPVGIAFDRHGDGTLRAVFRNGEERLEVEEVIEDGANLTLAFPAFNNRIDLVREGNRLSGTLTLVKRGGVRQTMPVRVMPDQPFRFFPGEQDVNADFGGKWAITFTDDEGDDNRAVGEFRQVNGIVTGTIRTPTGDYRYLEGQVRDRTLYLSTFDGAHAFLFHLRQDAQGLVSGDFWSGTAWHESLVARRDADAALPDATAMSRVNRPDEEIDFTFPDTDGEPVSFRDPRFEDKVVIVALAGTWCPNCHDEAAFLAPFYAARADRGLAVIGLMFEHVEDFDVAAEQVRRFRDKFDIGYELLVAGYSDKTSATATLGWLDRVIAFPTMVVFDRTGKVRLVHTGFNGPGTGVHYDEFRASFTALIDELLLEDSA